MWTRIKHKYIDPIHHKLNPLHIYCRLTEVSFINNKQARILSKIYDKLIYKILYPTTKKEE